MTYYRSFWISSESVLIRRKNNIFTTHLASSFIDCNVLIITVTDQEQLQSGTVWETGAFCNIKPGSFTWVSCRMNAIHMRMRWSFSSSSSFFFPIYKGAKRAVSAFPLAVVRGTLVCHFIWVLLSKTWWYFKLPDLCRFRSLMLLTYQERSQRDPTDLWSGTSSLFFSKRRGNRLCMCFRIT